MRFAIRLGVHFTLAVACGIFGSAPAQAAPAADPDAVTLIKLSTSVLKVEVIRAQGGYSLGSGVVIGADRVVTNCHVTRDARLISVLQDGLRLPAESQRVDAYHDLCVLQVPGIEGKRSVELGRSERLAVGQPVIAIGHTAGALQGSGGEVLALHRMDGGRVVQSSNFFSSGASGGGLFDADFKLVGILTFRLRGGKAHYFASPVEWLAASRVDPQAAQPIGPLARGELAFWERPADAQPAFLRAASLEVAGDWRALQPVAADWTQLDANDPEPWYLLGLAFARLGRPRDARLALECSLAIAPDYEVARSELDHVAPQRDAPVQTDVSGVTCRH